MLWTHKFDHQRRCQTTIVIRLCWFINALYFTFYRIVEHLDSPWILHSFGELGEHQLNIEGCFQCRCSGQGVQKSELDLCGVGVCIPVGGLDIPLALPYFHVVDHDATQTAASDCAWTVMISMEAVGWLCHLVLVHGLFGHCQPEALKIQNFFRPLCDSLLHPMVYKQNDIDITLDHFCQVWRK